MSVLFLSDFISDLQNFLQKALRSTEVSCEQELAVPSADAVIISPLVACGQACPEEAVVAEPLLIEQEAVEPVVVALAPFEALQLLPSALAVVALSLLIEQDAEAPVLVALAPFEAQQEPLDFEPASLVVKPAVIMLLLKPASLTTFVNASTLVKVGS